MSVSTSFKFLKKLRKKYIRPADNKLIPLPHYLAKYPAITRTIMSGRTLLASPERGLVTEV